jgi:hypothetical protein
VRLDEEEDDRDPKEIEREKYGDTANNLGLFGSSEEPAPPPLPEPEEETTFASQAAAFHEAPVTPELNALEIVPLDGIRDKKVKEIALEVPYARMSEETVKRIREIVEENAGEVPLSVTLVDLPEALAAERGEVRLKIPQHFRVQPGPALTESLRRVHANLKYVF